MKTEEILSKLPSSWDQVTLRQFQLLTSTPITTTGEITDGADNTLSVVSKLTSIPVNELEILPVIEVLVMGNKLSFITTTPEPSQNPFKIEWKKLDEITFNDYLSFLQLGEKQLENLHVFVKNFSKTFLIEEQILELPITDVLQGFFLFRNQSKEYLMTSIKSTRRKLYKQIMKEKIVSLKKRIWK